MTVVAHRPVPPLLIDELEEASIPFELLPHLRTTTAESEARMLGLPPHEVAKTVVLAVGGGYVRAVVPVSEHVALEKVRAFLRVHDVAIATEDEIVEAYPEFEPGAVPPLAGRGDQVLVDVRVLENDFAIVAAGTYDHSLRIPSRDLVAHESALLADIC